MDKKIIVKKFKEIAVAAVNSCSTCAAEHEPEEPHNLESLYYQVKFNLKYERFPCWFDAIAHCDLETKKLWKQELIKRGAWSEPDLKKKCHNCGAELKRQAGTCYICSVCGESEGCG